MSPRAALTILKLELLDPDIRSCLGIGLAQKHKYQGQRYGVRINLTLPGHELVVNRVHDEVVYVALRDAFDGMKRQLKDFVRLRRGMEKPHPVSSHGEIVRLDDLGGFGFIRTLAGDEDYFGRDNLTSSPLEHLRMGSTVQFIPKPCGDVLQARRVSLGKHSAA